jgi:tRNA-(ms[2]io[6]A)-hydroxylase
MLGLKLQTDPRWVNIAEQSISEILIDHAFCEQKAASSGISLIVHYPDKDEMVKELTAIIAEEWGHFRKVLKELDKRGFKFGKARKDRYVNELQKLTIKTDNRDKKLVEHLLVLAMIEARSCERFRLLSLHINDEELKTFYHEFMVSEAGHYRTFLNLAHLYADADYVKQRWQAILAGEAEIMKQMELRGDRVH